MCVDPVTAAAILTTAAAVVGGISSYKQGQAQQQAERFNAQIATQNAQFAEDDKLAVSEQAAIEQRRRGIQAQQDAGNIKARAAAMGIDSNFGSFDDLQKDVAQAYSIDSSVINANHITNLQTLDREQAGYKNQASLDIASGRQAMTAGKFGAVESLLKGASSVASQWIQPPSPVKGINLKTRPQVQLYAGG